jgi:hypothetical protein
LYSRFFLELDEQRFPAMLFSSLIENLSFEPINNAGALFLLLLSLIICICGHFLLRFVAPQVAADEPPLFESSIPLLGHTLSFGKDATAFYCRARLAHRRLQSELKLTCGRERLGPLNPFTCFIALRRFYFISDPFHAVHIMRNETAFSFTAAIADYMKLLFGVSDEGMELLRESMKPGAKSNG